jgi:hypothetical protein
MMQLLKQSTALTNYCPRLCFPTVKDSNEVVRRDLFTRLTPSVPNDLVMGRDESHRVVLLHDGTLP